MEMSNLRADSHVAQQRRRDKLRIQQHSDPSQHLEDYTSNLEQLSVHQGLNPDLIQLRNVKYGTISYDPTVFQTTEMLNYVTKNSQVLLSHNDSLVVAHQESAANQPNRPGNNVPFANLSHLNSSNLNASAKVSGDPQNCNTWKNIGSQESQQNCDWIVNYSGNSAGIESNQNPMFVGEGLSGPLKVNNIAASSLYMKPSSYGYPDVHSSLANPSGEISGHQSSEKHYGEMHFNSSTFYQDTLQEVVTSATMGTQGLEMAQSNIRETGRGSWVSGGNDSNELLLLPTYGDQSNPVSLNNGSTWMNRPIGGCHQWNGELAFFGHKSVRDRAVAAYDNSNTQGLSLSLSSVPAAKSSEGRCGERDDSEDLRSRTGVFNDLQNSKAAKSNFMCSNSKPSVSGRVFGNARQNLMGASSFTHPSTGPLGPFTGYATILKSSKYMKPTQQLLVEFCGVTGPKPIQTLEECSERISKEVSQCADAVNAAESMVGAKGGDSGASSSTFYGSNEISGEVGGRSSNTECYRPEYQQKKAKLLYMQEEVCKRYKQYHQQMQMVVSSFESVAGLSAATPYISVALRAVSRHFRCLKNAISDQLGHIKKALGEDLVVSNTTGISSSKGDTSSTSRLKFIEHSFQRHKTGGSNLGFFEPQPPVWRPQRGLPERAVSVLRAWLFDHFLHPYPTDTDKHMLATQTGLTRNQVSNWFINARVRVWKPMVEEIHTLETKGMAETNSNAGKPYGKTPSEGDNRPNDDLPTNSIRMSPNTQVECSGSASTRDGPSAELWNQEKRSRVECQIRGDMDGPLMGFVPYQRNGLEIGGLGAVSLTLGLRQSVESAQQQQQLQQQEHQLRQHFGGQMIHDFVG